MDGHPTSALIEGDERPAAGPHDTDAPAAATQRWLDHPWVARVLGVALGMVVLGPALRPGSLFSLDLILPESVPVPRGLWGLGPELPRRVPHMLPAAWLSPLVSASSFMKVVLILSIASAFVGIYRIVHGAGAGVVLAVAAGVFYAANPFLVTRIAAGHLMIVFAMAMLPWAYPVLLRPSASVARTLLWCSALGFTGNYGGVVAAIVVVVGMVLERRRRWVAVPAAWLVGQLPWFVPGLVVFGQGATLAGSAAFATRTDGLTGWLSVAVGHGFWQDVYQIGAPAGGDTALFSVVLATFALFGHRSLPAAWRRGAAVLAGIGAVVVYGSAVPGVREVLEWASGTPLGANLRESQRLYPLVAMWLAPASAFGAARVARLAHGAGPRLGGAMSSSYRALPCIGALLVTAPGMWGVGGHLVPVDMPAEWEQARQVIQADPGTTVVFPWYGYTDVDLGGTQHVLDPWPIYLGGDVLVSSDLRTSETPTPERVDAREKPMAELVTRLTAGQPPSARLAELGVRWVVFHRSGKFAAYGRVLESDPGLERVVLSVRVLVYRVKGWKGPAVDEAGRAVGVLPVVEPLALPSTTAPFTWYRPYATGWLRGTTPATATADGLIRVPEGEGPLWYWPTLLVLAGYQTTLVAVAVAGRRVHRRRRPVRAPPAAVD